MLNEKNLRYTLFVLVIFSVLLNYYVMIVKKDYDILTNPDGLPTLE